MTLLSLFTAVVLALALSGGQLAFAWFFMGNIQDRAALRLASLVSLTSVIAAAIAWTLGMDPAFKTWWDGFVLSWLAGLAAGIGLLWHVRARALATMTADNA